jgi:molybdate transport system ATP-binding protein
LSSSPPSARHGLEPAGGLHVRFRKRLSRFELDAAFAAASGVTVIVGPSGAGKSTILRCIAGLCDPEEGRVAVGGRVLFDASQRIRLEPARRSIAFVFQDLALFPHLSVQDNVMYGLRRLDAPERQRRMREILEAFQIAHLRGRSPREISGGEQQRVALARSLVTEPAVLLLDEPLSSLDPRTKVRIIEDLQRWNHTRRIPILYITHDYGELLAMGDRAIAVEQGRIVAEGLPLDVVASPPRAALAQPAGFENLFDATVRELLPQEATMVCQLTGTPILLRVPLAEAVVGSEICLGIRAGEILVSALPPAILSACNVIPGKIKQLERTGPVAVARVGGGAEFRVRLDSHCAEPGGLDVAADVWLMISTHACHLVRPVPLDALKRLFVFVCHGNTIRSPMAQAICNAEIAGRFGVSLESLDRLGVKAVSAGLTARPGEPIAVEAEQALAKIGLPVLEHRSRNLTHRLAQRAEAIFCMTEEQRRELTTLFPAAQPKSYRLHPEGDIGDLHGQDPEEFLDCALRIQDLIRHRLDRLGVAQAKG